MALNPDKDINLVASKQTLKLYYQATMRHKKTALLALTLTVSVIFLSVAAPYFASKTIASLVQHNDASQYLWLFLGTIVIGLVLNRIGIRACMRIQAAVMHDLQMTGYQHLLSRSVGFFNARIGGKLVSDVLDFSNSYSVLFIAVFIKGFGFVSTILVGVAVLFFASWQLGLLILSFLVTIITWTIMESRQRSSLRVERLKTTKLLTSYISDGLVNATTVKTFATEEREVALASTHSIRQRNLRMQDWQRAVTSETYRVGAVYIMQFALLAALLLLSRNNPALLATGIFAFTYTITISSRFFEINTIIRQIEESFLNASPLTNALRETPEILDAPGAVPLEVQAGTIDFTNVSFKYADAPKGENVFTSLNLNIKPGEKIGLVGKSGGGKSTLTRLLLRFDTIQDGSIFIDGQDISKVTQASLRHAIAYVPQEPLLFHRSILENIKYGNPDASQEAITTAAEKAFALEFIMQLPQGFDTLVGERGVKLSGGQRQRIAIARAILKDAPILLLDEATSALDSESEQYIQKSLNELMKNRTSIVVAHRLSTIQKMDRIIVIDNGTIIEEGSHSDLVQAKGTYAKLWAHQSDGFIEE